MKKSLSGNTWSGSVWDSVSIYKKKTQEQKADGSYVTVTAEFRKYPNVGDSIADHSAYLLGAKNGEKLRYDGLKGCSDYKKAVQIIKEGGYATSLTYVEKLCSYYGAEVMVPLYIHVEDGERLQRALNRRKTQKVPKYAEMCRKVLS